MVPDIPQCVGERNGLSRSWSPRLSRESSQLGFLPHRLSAFRLHNTDVRAFSRPHAFSVCVFEFQASHCELANFSPGRIVTNWVNPVAAHATDLVEPHIRRPDESCIDEMGAEGAKRCSNSGNNPCISSARSAMRGRNGTPKP